MRTKNTLQRLEAEHDRRSKVILTKPVGLDGQVSILLREERRHLRAMIRHHDQIQRERLAALESELVTLRETIRVDDKRRAAEAREHRREIAAYIRDTAKS
jgi:hypothetical protein